MPAKMTMPPQRLPVPEQQPRPAGKREPAARGATTEARAADLLVGERRPRGSRGAIRSSGRSHARVEDDVEDVHDEVGDEDADGEEQQQRLRQRVVGAERRLLERQAGAGVAEDELDEDQPADGRSELGGEAGERGRTAFRPA